MWSLDKFKSVVNFSSWPKTLRNIKPLEFLWSFRIKGKPEDIWFYLADTTRFNRELQFAKRTTVEKNGNAIVTTKMLGLKQEWVEEPWSWVVGRSISINRTYSIGVAKYFRVIFHLERGNDETENLVYIYFGWLPASHAWRTFLKITMPIVRKKYDFVFRKIEHYLDSNRDEAKIRSALQTYVEPLRIEQSRKIRQLRDELIERGQKTEIVDRLIKHIQCGDELELKRLRIIPLAKTWGFSKKDLLVTCLHATRVGLLSISWDIICPHCRGARYGAKDLGDLPAQYDCDVCKIDFKTDRFDSVEVTFHVHPSIRIVEDVKFCTAEPTKKEHIRVQHLLEPGRKVTLQVNLREGRHRLRQVGSENSYVFEAQDGRPDTHLIWDGGGSAAALAPIGQNPTLTLDNKGRDSKVFVLEELWWENQSLKPVDVFTLQEFRDLFSVEHLNTDVRLSLGHQTIMFTDIVGSTKFYQNEGDARAFKEVRDHFVHVFNEVKKKNGAVVKTIGDAVMAAFHSPEEALAAAVDIQLRFHEHRPECHILLRISIHTGPVMAVHLHQGIDYFGGTVNLAAKLQACAEACEVALSEDMYRLCTISSDHLKNYPVEKRAAPTILKSGAPLEACVVKVERRQKIDRRKMA